MSRMNFMSNCFMQHFPAPWIIKILQLEEQRWTGLAHPSLSSSVPGWVTSWPPHFHPHRGPSPPSWPLLDEIPPFFSLSFCTWSLIWKERSNPRLHPDSTPGEGLTKGQEEARSTQSTGGVFPWRLLWRKPSAPKISEQTCLSEGGARQKAFLLANMAQSWGDLPWLLLFLLLAQDPAVSASCKEVMWHTASISRFCWCKQQGARAGESVMGAVHFMCTTAQQSHNAAPSHWQGTSCGEWNVLGVLQATVWWCHFCIADPRSIWKTRQENCQEKPWALKAPHTPCRIENKCQPKKSVPLVKIHAQHWTDQPKHCRNKPCSSSLSHTGPSFFWCEWVQLYENPTSHHHAAGLHASSKTEYSSMDHGRHGHLKADNRCHSPGQKNHVLNSCKGNCAAGEPFSHTCFQGDKSSVDVYWLYGVFWGQAIS